MCAEINSFRTAKNWPQCVFFHGKFQQLFKQVFEYWLSAFTGSFSPYLNKKIKPLRLIFNRRNCLTIVIGRSNTLTRLRG